MRLVYKSSANNDIGNKKAKQSGKEKALNCNEVAMECNFHENGITLERSY